jgi:hypothetical protein
MVWWRLPHRRFESRLDPTAVDCMSLRQLLAENFADYVSQHKIEGEVRYNRG